MTHGRKNLSVDLWDVLMGMFHLQVWMDISWIVTMFHSEWISCIWIWVKMIDPRKGMTQHKKECWSIGSLILTNQSNVTMNQSLIIKSGASLKPQTGVCPGMPQRYHRYPGNGYLGRWKRQRPSTSYYPWKNLQVARSIDSWNISLPRQCLLRKVWDFGLLLLEWTHYTDTCLGTM